MADKDDDKQKGEGGAKKKSPIKLIAIVAVLMLVEGAVVYGVVSMTSPSSSKAADLELQSEEQAALEEPVEIELAAGRYLNLTTGRAWSWKAEIYVRSKEKHRAEIESTVERNRVRIDEMISEVFARSEDQHLREPGRETLKRRLLEIAQRVFGTDADDNPIVTDVMIVGFQGSPIDY